MRETPHDETILLKSFLDFYFKDVPKIKDDDTNADFKVRISHDNTNVFLVIFDWNARINLKELYENIRKNCVITEKYEPEQDFNILMTEQEINSIIAFIHY